MVSIKNFTKTILIALVALLASQAFVSVAEAKIAVNTETNAGTGTISGIVKDEKGSPISGAFVAIFRVGTSNLLKQVRSAADGSYLAKIIPGTYTILAVAEGYNPVTLQSVEVGQSTKLNYGFKLVRSGSGNTLPEKRADRKNPLKSPIALEPPPTQAYTRLGSCPVRSKIWRRASMPMTDWKYVTISGNG